MSKTLALVFQVLFMILMFAMLIVNASILYKVAHDELKYPLESKPIPSLIKGNFVIEYRVRLFEEYIFK